MRKIILTLLMALFPLIAHATSYEITTPGNNVGIGTTTPGQALDVNGTIRSIDFKNSSNTSIVASGTAGQNAYYASSTNAVSPTNDIIFNGNDFYNNVGNVGIGTSFTQGGAALTVMNGNVGIGTWGPSGLLQVGTGTGFEVNSAGKIVSLSGDSNANVGNTGINLHSAGGEVIIQNNSSNSGSVLGFIGGNAQNSYLEARATGNVGIGTEVPLKITAGNNGSLEIARFIHNGTGNGYPSDSVGLGIGTTFGSGALMVMGGNVGIGTWNPSNKLIVNGNVGIGTVVSNGGTLGIGTEAQAVGEVACIGTGHCVGWCSGTVTDIGGACSACSCLTHL